MAKQKNHTNENQNWKWHRNGVIKPQKGRRSLAGVYRPLLKNMRYAKAGNSKWGPNQALLVAAKKWREENKAKLVPKPAGTGKRAARKAAAAKAAPVKAAPAKTAPAKTAPVATKEQPKKK